jgi:hypothetical protein
LIKIGQIALLFTFIGGSFGVMNAGTIERTDKVIIALEVLLEGVDDEDDELVILIKEEGGGHVANFLKQQVGLVAHLDRVDITERGIVTEHLHVD